MDFKNIEISIENKIAYLIISRPKALNALNKETILELEEAVKILCEDQKVWVIILRGKGEKAFVAGADIKEMKGLDRKEAKQFSLMGQRVFQKIEDCKKPVIAAINGHALGGGMELALACDLRIASEDAKLGQPEVGLGIIPGFGATQRLSSLIGKGLAKEYIFTGRFISAEKANSIGLINQVTKKDELMDKVKKLAEEIVKNSPSAITRAKKAINYFDQSLLEEGLNKEAEIFASCFLTYDQKEGMESFIKREKAQFKGEQGGK